jgi:hypothetical protein
MDKFSSRLGARETARAMQKQGESRGRKGERERESGRAGEGETNEREKQQEQCKATRVMFPHEFVNINGFSFSPIYPNRMALVRITEFQKNYGKIIMLVNLWAFPPVISA